MENEPQKTKHKAPETEQKPEPEVVEAKPVEPAKVSIVCKVGRWFTLHRQDILGAVVATISVVGTYSLGYVRGVGRARK